MFIKSNPKNCIVKNKKKLFVGVVAIVVILFLGTLLSNSGNMLTGKLNYKIRKKNDDQTRLPSIGEVAIAKFPGCKRVMFTYAELIESKDGQTGINFDGIVDTTVDNFVEQLVDGALFRLIIGDLLADQDFIETAEVLIQDSSLDMPDYSFRLDIHTEETTFNEGSSLEIMFPFIDSEVLVTTNEGHVFKLSGQFLKDVYIRVEYNSDVRGNFEFGYADHLGTQNVFAGEAKANLTLTDAEFFFAATIDENSYQLVRVMDDGSETKAEHGLVRDSVALFFNLYGGETFDLLSVVPPDILSEYNIVLTESLEDAQMSEMTAILLARQILLNAGSFSNVELVFSERIQTYPTDDHTHYSYFCDKGQTKQTTLNPFLITPTYKYVKNWIDYNF